MSVHRKSDVLFASIPGERTVRPTESDRPDWKGNQLRQKGSLFMKQSANTGCHNLGDVS
jgi:hypothetical protein